MRVIKNVAIDVNPKLILKITFEQAAGCKAVHADTEAVVEVFRGQVMWEGVVEIFDIQGHPKAKRAYGWGTGEGKEAKYTAVLEIPPVISSNTAVRAAIAAEARSK